MTEQNDLPVDLDLFELFESPVLWCDELLTASAQGSQQVLNDVSNGDDVNEISIDDILQMCADVEMEERRKGMDKSFFE